MQYRARGSPWACISLVFAFSATRFAEILGGVAFVSRYKCAGQRLRGNLMTRMF